MALQDIKVKLALDIKEFQNALNKAKTDTQGLSKSFVNAMGPVKNAIIGVSTALAGISTVAMKEFMDTEASIAKVNTLINLSGEEFKTYSNDIKAGAKEAGMAYDDFSEAVYQAISAGVEYGNAVDFVNSANKLAKGGFTDLSTATDITTTVLNAYKMSAEDQTKVMDLLIQTQNKGKTTVDELGSSLGKVIPTAKANNVAFEQVSASIAMLTAGGIATAESVTYLKSMLSEMGKSGSQVSDILKEKTGKSFQQLMEDGATLSEVLEILDGHAKDNSLSLADLFSSSEAATAAMSLLGESSSEYNNVLAQMNEATGATDSAFNTMNDTLKEQLNQSVNHLKNGLSDLGSELYDRLGPAISDTIEWFGDMIYKLAEIPSWIEENKTMLTYLGIALGTVTTAIGAYILAANASTIATTIATVAGTAFGAVIAFITSPITLTILAIGALIAAVYALATNWDWISEKTSEVWHAMGDWINKTCENIASSVGEWWGNICDKTNAWLEDMKAKFIEGFDKMIDSTIQFCTNVKDTIVNGWNQAVENTKQKLSEMYNTAVQKWTDMCTAARQKFDDIKTNITTRVTNIKDNIKQGFETAYNTVRDTFSKIFNSVKDKIESARDTVKNAIDKIKGFFNFNWSLPKLKLPHISISGKFSLSPLSVPKFGINWYSSGGIFTKKTVLPNGIGVGDAINGVGNAAEAVLPIDELPKLIGLDKLFDLVDSNKNNNTATEVPVIAPEGNVTMSINLDSFQIAEAVFPFIDLLQAKQIRLDTFSLGGRT